MASAPLTALRAELLAALEVIEPQLRGLKNMVNDPFSPEASATLQEQITALERRKTLINSTLARLDELEADGYPERPPVLVPASVLAEYERKEADVEAAVDMFEPVGPVATAVTVFPPPTDAT